MKCGDVSFQILPGFPSGKTEKVDSLYDLHILRHCHASDHSGRFIGPLNVFERENLSDSILSAFPL